MRRYLVINFWTSEQLKFRESKELANGDFGNGVDAEKGDEELESGYILVSLSNCIFFIKKI